MFQERKPLTRERETLPPIPTSDPFVKYLLFNITSQKTLAPSEIPSHLKLPILTPLIAASYSFQETNGMTPDGDVETGSVSYFSPRRDPTRLFTTNPVIGTPTTCEPVDQAMVRLAQKGRPPVLPEHGHTEDSFISYDDLVSTFFKKIYEDDTRPSNGIIIRCPSGQQLYLATSETLPIMDDNEAEAYLDQCNNRFYGAEPELQGLVSLQIIEEARVKCYSSTNMRDFHEFDPARSRYGTRPTRV